MTTHYEEFRLYDPAVIARIVARWPFATIVANGPQWPAVAHAPLMVSRSTDCGEEGLGAIEFHVARANPALSSLGPDTAVTLSLQGPSAHVSPSWYVGRFPDASSDRSRTAPTWDYLALTLRGRLVALSDAELAAHLSDLVGQNEGKAGWQIAEIDSGFFSGLRNHILGYRVHIESFDCVAKFSQNRSAIDVAGIVAGLKARGLGQDLAVAELVESLEAITG